MKSRGMYVVRVARKRVFGGVQHSSSRSRYFVEMVARSASRWARNACRPAGVSRTQVRGFRLMRPFSMLTISSSSSVAKFFDSAESDSSMTAPSDLKSARSTSDSAATIDSLTGERRVWFNPWRGWGSGDISGFRSGDERGHDQRYGREHGRGDPESGRLRLPGDADGQHDCVARRPQSGRPTNTATASAGC